MQIRKFCLTTILLIAVATLSPPGWCQNETAATGNSAGAVQIRDAVICRDVVDRQPIGSSDVFPKQSGKLFCFTRIVGAVGQSWVVHNWYYQGALKSSVRLPVRSSNWRTWSAKSIEPAWVGEWMVEVLSEEGTPLDSIIFFVR
jgi:Protein of unknown function (DUF2914)